MSTPIAPVFEKVADPSDITDFIAVIREVDTANGEGIASHTITLSAEAEALGVTISSASIVADPETDAEATAIKFWLSVDEDHREDRAFDEGVIVGVTITIVTTASDPRTLSEAFAVQIAQKKVTETLWGGVDLVVEDGTGLSTADSYASLTDADAFNAKRGNTAWAAATVATRESAMRVAADWLDANYVFVGTRLTSAQALQWPRYLSDGTTTIPPRIAKAQMMAALEALSGPLMPRQEAAPVTSVRQKLEGVGELETTYAEAKQSRYPQIDAMLSDLVSSRSGASMTTVSVLRG